MKPLVALARSYMRYACMFHSGLGVFVGCSWRGWGQQMPFVQEVPVWRRFFFCFCPEFSGALPVVLNVYYFEYVLTMLGALTSC